MQQERAALLRAERKLILVCDLDQTLVHACVDAAVEHWIAGTDVRVRTHAYARHTRTTVA